MKKSVLRFKKLAFSIVLAFGLLFPMTIFAQQTDGFFRGGNDNYQDREVSINDGGGINNYGIGETVPLGGGLLILTAAGASYAVLRRKKCTKLLLALALLLGMTQCKKNVETISNPAAIPGVHITLDVCGDDGSKVVVTPGYENPVTHEVYANVKYEDGDIIYVGYNNNYVGYLTYTSTVENTGYFSGDVSIAAPVGEQPLHFYLLGGKGFTPTIDGNIATVVISDQSEQYPVISYYHSNEPYTGSGPYTSKLRNKCSIMKFNVVTESTSPICIMGMNNKVTVDFTTPNGTDNGFSYSKDGAGEIKMTAGGGTAENPAVKWAIVLPQDALSAGTNEAYTAISGSNPYMTGNRPAIPVIHSNEYHSDATDRTITVNETPYFTVNEGGQKVLFAPGNLQYTISTGKWSLLSHQYDIVEETSWGRVRTNYIEGTKGVYSDYVTLFKWSATGWINPNPPLPDAEIPNCTNMDDSPIQANLTVAQDWGTIAHNNTNDANLSGYTWRTPTEDEWIYVSNRIVAKDKNSYGYAVVESVKGLILLPDNWNGAIDPGFVYGVVDGETNTYSSSTEPTWSTMEAAGAVFLPAAGYRNERYIYYESEWGTYWSINYGGIGDDGYGDDRTKAHAFSFKYFGYAENPTYPNPNNPDEGERDGVEPDDNDCTYLGSSVRLIRDIE